MKVIEEGFEKYLHIYPKNHLRIGWASLHVGRVYRAIGDFQKAKDFFKRGYEIYSKYYGENHIRNAEILNEQALNFFLEGNLTTSKDLVLKSLELLKRQSNNTNKLLALKLLIRIYVKELQKTINPDDINISLENIEKTKSALCKIRAEILSNFHSDLATF